MLIMKVGRLAIRFPITGNEGDKAMAITIIHSVQSPEYDMRGIRIDLSRKTGVLIRQSRKGADLDARESRLRQESLVPVAVALRGDTDTSNILLYDEGSGVSGTKGYDERPQLSRLYLDIANGLIGSIAVARADRLFRDKHFRNVSMFTEIAERQRIILIVPGKAVYDFTKTRDLQAFQREMQEAYNYIATQIAYMMDTRAQKVQRGFYGGGRIPAPYAIERSTSKDQQILVIYKPWHEIALDLFRRFESYDFVLSRIARYIEEQPYIFPYPSAEDVQRYMFSTLMRRAAGGYTFSSADSLRNYFSNLTLGGYAKIGKDSEGNILLLADAFEPAIPMELLAASYGAIIGHYPDGSPCARRRIQTRMRNATEMGSPALLHGLLESDDGSVSYYSNNTKARPIYICHKGTNVNGWAISNKVGIMRQQKAWSTPCEDLDDTVVRRLCELSRHDADMSDRIRAFWDARKSDEVNEAELTQTQIDRAAAQIQRLDKLLTDPAASLTTDMERSYIELRRQAEADVQRLTKKKSAIVQQVPEEVIPNFYHVLSHLPNEFARLTPDSQKRMARQVIKQIRLNIISPHLFLLHVEWQNGIAACADIALVWRGVTPNNAKDWTSEEDEIMRRMYSTESQANIMRELPERAWNRILERAQVLGLRRAVSHAGPHPFNVYHRTVSYRDLEAAANLVDDPEQQNRMRQVVNDLARRTVRGGLSAYWLFPLDAVGYLQTARGESIPGPALLNVNAFACEWRHRGG